MLRSVGISQGSVSNAPPVWTNPPPPRAPFSIQTVTTLPVATEGVPYSITFVATGANRYAVVDRTAPPPIGSAIFVVENPETYLPAGQHFPIGMSLNQSTGVLSGRPLTLAALGGNPALSLNTTFWIGACRTDAANRIMAIQIRPFSLIVGPQAGFNRTRPTWVSMANVPLGTFTEGQSLNVAMQATDPSGVSFRAISPWVASGTVPGATQSTAGTVGGLTINSDGSISGVPQVTHDVNTSVIVRAQNPNGFFRDQPIALRILNVRRAPTWLTPAGEIARGRRGGRAVFPNFTLPGSNQVRARNELEALPDFSGFAIRYRIISGALPPGIIPTTRTLSGLPERTVVGQQNRSDIRTFWFLSGGPVPVRAAAGTYTFTVRCEYTVNSGEQFADRTFSIVVT